MFRIFGSLRRPFCSVIALLLLLLSAQCGGPDAGDRPERPREPLPAGAEKLAINGQFGGRLRYPLAGEPETFNPLAAQEARSRLVAFLTTATLLEFDPVRQEITPGLAERYSLSNDGTRITIGYREGVRFSDGAPFSTDDILFTFRKIYEEESQNVFKDSLLIDGEPLRLKALSPTSIEIEFPRPWGAALFLLSTVPILPSHLFETFEGPIEEAWTLSTPPEEMAGLGPYRLQTHLPGIRSLLEYNPHFWKVDSAGRRLPYIDQMALEYIEDRNAQVLRLQSGELDLIDQLLRPDDFLVLRQESGIETRDAGPSSNLTFFWLNLGDSPESALQRWFQNRTFRAALNRSISRQAIVQNVFSGYASEASTLLSAAHRGWFLGDNEESLYDPSHARALLSSEGFRWERIEGKEVLIDPQGNQVRFELLTLTDDVPGQIAAIIQQDLAEIGIELSLNQKEFREVISRIMRSRDYEAALMNVDFPIDPSDMMNVFLSDGAMHMWHPGQESPSTPWERRMDELMLQQAWTLNDGERRKLFGEVQAIVAHQLPLIPLAHRDVLVAWREQLENLQIAQVFPYALSHPWAIYFRG